MDHRRGRDQFLRSRMKLRRGADGQLRSDQDDDIGDVWAEQRRIKLKEAIEEDKRRAEKAKQGKWAFLRQKKKTSTPKEAAKTDGVAAKEVVVTINVPKVKIPKLPKDKIVRFIRSLPRKQQIVGGVVVLFVLISTVGFFMYGNAPKKEPAGKKVAATTTSIPRNQKPDYDTLLPEGKTIEELGGWGRISPPDKEPVYAYTDTISGVPVIVSEQPLPANFRKDVSTELEKLAKQFGATEKVTAESLTAFVGTSIKGPQSVILAKNNILVLIRSETKVDNQSWADYISALY